MPNEKIEAARKRLKRRRKRKRADERASARRIRRNEPEGVVERVKATGRQTRLLFEEMGMGGGGDTEDGRDERSGVAGMLESLGDHGERSNRLVAGEDHDDGELMDFGFGGQEPEDATLIYDDDGGRRRF